MTIGPNIGSPLNLRHDRLFAAGLHKSRHLQWRPPGDCRRSGERFVLGEVVWEILCSGKVLTWWLRANWRKVRQPGWGCLG